MRPFIFPGFTILGLILLVIGLIGMKLVKFDRDFYINLLPMVGAMVIFLVLTFYVGGKKEFEPGHHKTSAEFCADGFKMVRIGLNNAARITMNFLPTLVLVFLVMGLASTIMAEYLVPLRAYMGGKGGVIGSLGAALAMPGSLTGLPIVRDLWYTEGMNQTPLAVFLLTAPMIGWQMYFLQVPALGWRLATITFALKAIVAIGITLVALMIPSG